MNNENINKRRVAVVTGGARGIGLGIGKWFLRHGYQVALLDIDKVTLDKTMQSIGSEDVIGIHCDVSKPQEVEKGSSRFNTVCNAWL